MDPKRIGKRCRSLPALDHSTISSTTSDRQSGTPSLMITIPGTSDHDRLERLITIPGMRNPVGSRGTGLARHWRKSQSAGPPNWRVSCLQRPGALRTPDAGPLVPSRAASPSAQTRGGAVRSCSLPASGTGRRRPRLIPWVGGDVLSTSGSGARSSIDSPTGPRSSPASSAIVFTRQRGKMLPAA